MSDAPRECEHGQLARSCDRCADAREIAELRAEVERLRSEAAEEAESRELMRGVLQRTAIALKGPEPPNAWWGWGDLVEVAEGLRRDAERYRWLRNPGEVPGDYPVISSFCSEGTLYELDEADAEVDAAIRASRAAGEQAA